MASGRRGGTKNRRSAKKTLGKPRRQGERKKTSRKRGAMKNRWRTKQKGRMERVRGR